MRVVQPFGRRSRASAAAIGLLAVTGAACIAFALLHRDHPPVAPPLTSVVTAPTTTALPSASPRPEPALELARSLPVSVSIPAIRVHTSLQQLGQAANGTIAVPQPGPHYDEAGWYRYSPTPGERGPAVLVGHVDSARGGPSVFYRLGELHRGDSVSVARADGSVAVFTVDDVRRFAKSAFPTALVYGNTPNAALRLITCGGPFDRTSGHYLDNVVVTASLARVA